MTHLILSEIRTAVTRIQYSMFANDPPRFVSGPVPPANLTMSNGQYKVLRQVGEEMDPKNTIKTVKYQDSWVGIWGNDFLCSWLCGSSYGCDVWYHLLGATECEVFVLFEHKSVRPYDAIDYVGVVSFNCSAFAGFGKKGAFGIIIKGLTIPEALEVFHNLPSDIESDESSLSEAEDVMTAKSSSSENTDIHE
ncbi:hypothetical protein TNIN_95611 [Trichonephila inaurata madagascariensis]|uniref:Uncharacterized protein n=1 Tax=Trichonephila inaurata madagascariensis TaxID=2747483 RepID=A0A8X7BVW3_9ARAC|nr:hypothetical protein TNIN_95611 [Trichonephila inaurata madagascariensis]